MYIELHPDGSPCSVVFDRITLSILVTLNRTYPPGFNLSAMEKSCDCEPRLAQYTGEHKCIITNGVGNITHDVDRKFWVGYDDQSHGLTLNSFCPFDYCVSQAVNFSLNNTDMQCAHTGQASCVELARKVTVWYKALLIASSVPTVTISCCSFLLH